MKIVRGDGVEDKVRVCVDEGSEGEAYADGGGEDGEGEEEIGDAIW